METTALTTATTVRITVGNSSWVAAIITGTTEAIISPEAASGAVDLVDSVVAAFTGEEEVMGVAAVAMADKPAAGIARRLSG